MTLHEEMSMAAHARIAESLRPGSTPVAPARPTPQERTPLSVCLLYTSDAADE